MNKAIIDRAIKLLEEAQSEEDSNKTWSKIAQVQGILETVSSMLGDKELTLADKMALSLKVTPKPLPANTEPPIPAKDNMAFVQESGDYSPFPLNEPK